MFLNFDLKLCKKIIAKTNCDKLYDKVSPAVGNPIFSCFLSNIDGNGRRDLNEILDLTVTLKKIYEIRQEIKREINVANPTPIN